MPCASPSTPVVDLRLLDETASTAALVASFDAMRPGERLHVIAQIEPDVLLERLQRERQGCPDAWSCSHDPLGWHIDISCGRHAPKGSLGNVGELLEHEHRRLAALCQQAFDAHASGRHTEAREEYAAFRRGLLRHIRLEEDLLFPVFEIRAGLSTEGPTAAMRAEHRDIRLLLDELARALDERRVAATALKRALDCLLSEHDRKELALLYPVLDRLLAPGEGAALVARFEALQELNEARS